MQTADELSDAEHALVRRARQLSELSFRLSQLAERPALFHVSAGAANYLDSDRGFARRRASAIWDAERAYG
jgi:hypothetical protein